MISPSSLSTRNKILQKVLLHVRQMNSQCGMSASMSKSRLKKILDPRGKQIQAKRTLIGIDWFAEGRLEIPNCFT